MRQKAAYLIIFLVTLFLPSVEIVIAEASEPEVEKLRAEFEKIVGFKLTLEEGYLKLVLEDAVGKILSIKENGQSQYFIYVDRNPEKQIILICFFDSVRKNITVIGADKISTGNQNRRGYFITPVGVFEHTIKNRGYRALGTKNEKGWRGLGAKGSRVWDFGWQKTPKDNQEVEIRLLLHATDPVFGEKRLGKIDSKGCIRISGKLNKFLDHYGILDKDYEEQKHLKGISWLLRTNREPMIYGGKYLLIGDSAKR
ncbi:MAG: murein L,D-transpeptidase [Candidatus Azambacteria bacterium]|nr:murein L,D-transpeptidase [Candidatus Azambacteria bacterium]